MSNIKAADLAEMIEHGADLVIANRQKINKINVFPVPDRDTGENMANTFLGIKKALLSKSDNFESVIDNILNASLSSSQGNSGIMIASFLNGLLTGFKNKTTLSSSDLTVGLLEGAKNARASVENPVEGTMLDVMDAFAADFKSKAEIKEAMEYSLHSCEKALVATEQKMETLSRNHVVDAGALGFTIFIFGFCEKITRKKLDLSKIDAKPVEMSHVSFGDYNFEVVFIISDAQFEIEDVRKMFHPLGNSLDVVEIENKIKVHIHTNAPEEVVATSLLIGTIESTKTVDMREGNFEHS